MTSIKDRFRNFNILRNYEGMFYKEFVDLGVKAKNENLQMLDCQAFVSF
ncbi:hypothetical protein [Thermodesulfovibrio yellowstonii]|nr:hypothetical protein [Thermodesulfovibrio islandicus]